MQAPSGSPWGWWIPSSAWYHTGKIHQNCHLRFHPLRKVRSAYNLQTFESLQRYRFGPPAPVLHIPGNRWAGGGHWQEHVAEDQLAHITKDAQIMKQGKIGLRKCRSSLVSSKPWFHLKLWSSLFKNYCPPRQKGQRSHQRQQRTRRRRRLFWRNSLSKNTGDVNPWFGAALTTWRRFGKRFNSWARNRPMSCSVPGICWAKTWGVWPGSTSKEKWLPTRSKMHFTKLLMCWKGHLLTWKLKVLGACCRQVSWSWWNRCGACSAGILRVPACPILSLAACAPRFVSATVNQQAQLWQIFEWLHVEWYRTVSSSSSTSSTKLGKNFNVVSSDSCSRRFWNLSRKQGVFWIL